MIIGNKKFEGHTYIMGILNVTPDSFSDGGRFNTQDAALRQAQKMIEEGADIIDVGGESTRPGYTLISDDEEISRVVPVIEKIKAEFDIPVSIDTYKSGVASAALKAGADLVNDIWGLKYDEKMASVVKNADASVCIMHNRKNTDYTDFLSDIISDLSESLSIAEKAMIPREKIIIDPGIGFAKSYEQNLEITNRLEVLDRFGLPVLYAASRKSMIGLTLDLPSDQRLEGTIATSVIAVLKNSLFIRVHDVKENKRAVMMAEKITGKL